jgi:hypothetical protein
MRIHQTLALLGAVLLSSCTFARAEINNSHIPELVANHLKLGETTSQQIIDGIGTPPGQIIFLPNKEKLFIYNYGQSKTKGLTLILFNSLRTNVAIDTAIFHIDANGTVDEAWIGDNSENVPWEWWAFGE